MVVYFKRTNKDDKKESEDRCPYCNLSKEDICRDEGLPHCHKDYYRHERIFNTVILMMGPVYVGFVMAYLHPHQWQPIAIISGIATGVMFFLGRLFK